MVSGQIKGVSGYSISFNDEKSPIENITLKLIC